MSNGALIAPGPSTAKTVGVLREEAARAETPRWRSPTPSPDPWKALAAERKARLAAGDRWQTDHGVIPPPRQPAWEPLPEAVAFLEVVHRLREASPRQDLPPAETADEPASRQRAGIDRRNSCLRECRAAFQEVQRLRPAPKNMRQRRLSTKQNMTISTVYSMAESCG